MNKRNGDCSAAKVSDVEENDVRKNVAQLLEWFQPFDTALVCFSGGVDSAVVAKAAQLTLADRAVALIATGPALAASELASARESAQSIGIELREADAEESKNSDYRRNDELRCYHCKSHLYQLATRELERLCARVEIRQSHTKSLSLSKAVLVNGTNVDDLSDYRPGLRAAEEYGVRQPLAELRIPKSQVRRIAQYWNLEVSEKPAAPCLASRIAYGEPADAQTLGKIERAEEYLHLLGYDDVRVRWHAGGIARVELPIEQTSEFLGNHRVQIVAHFREIGFTHVTLDLEGRQSGSLNRSLPILHTR